MITVQLLGGASLRAGDTPINGPPAQRHRIALLTLIVATWPQPLSRDRAMALLWPERDVASARRLLNLAIHVIRATLGDDVIVSAGDALLLNPSRLACDLHELRAAIGAGATDRVAHLYTGPLLDGFHLADSPEFSYWLDQRRGELAHAYVGALLTLAEQQDRAGDVHGRVGTCRRLTSADPYSGVFARMLMLALDAAGDRGAAIQHAREHARRVRDDLALEPDPEVIALARQLRVAPTRSTTSVVPGTAMRTSTPSVAVLPFRALGADVDGDYFADGITEDVIAHLAKIRALKVISRASVMRFRERDRPLREIAAALGVDVVLDGSVRRDGNRVRIVAPLVDAATERQLWVETYDREITDIFAIQSEVALQIATALRAELTPDERTRVRRDPARDVLAYQLFLQGRRRMWEFTDVAMLSSIDFFERALARDPAIAIAHAYIAMTYSQLAETGIVPPELAYARAGAAASEGIRLDPGLGVAHCALGHVRAAHDFDWAVAESEFRCALELSPGSADTYNLYGRLCAGLGRFDEAVDLLTRAQELDPLVHRVDLATTLIRAERYEEAVQRAEHALALDADFDRAHATLAWAYILTGRSEEGIAELERAVAIAPDSNMWLGQLAQAHGMVGSRDRAREILHQLEQRALTAWVSPYNFAYAYTGLGDHERAMDWLERAVATRTGPVYGLRGTFLFRPLRGHPRFQALLRQMKLEA